VHAAPTRIRTPAELTQLARDLAGVEAVAVDTEADSLHHYPERLCLIQIADPAGRVVFVDPLALPGLEPLGALFADPATVKVFHSAENDLAHLKRRLGVVVARVFDTRLAASLLGAKELGLGALLTRYLGVTTVKSQQKTNWAQRPLTPAQEAYAAEDVRYLIPLSARLAGEIRAAGREAWLAEECEALAALPVVERAPDDNGYRRLPGASRLDPPGLGVLRLLHAQREAWALAERRPPFKVLGHETLVALAARRPRSAADLAGVPGLPPRLVDRYGAGLLEAITRGLAAPPPASPRPASPRPRGVPPEVRHRADALRRWRAAAATETGLDPGVLLPQRLIDVLAAAPPGDLTGLGAVPGFRRWRAETFGPAILAALGQPFSP
jgi:ribonuclease D